MRNIALSILAFLVCAGIADAKVVLPPIFSDNMVLQQQNEVKIWGRASGRIVTCQASWLSEPVSATVREKAFELLLPTPQGSFAAQTVVIQDSDSEIILNNVLIGDVWICSGQSNMEMTMRGYSRQPVHNALQSILESGRYEDRVHIFTIARTESDKPKAVARGSWKPASPESVTTTSATAWYFAKSLADAVDVPIGIITASRSSANIETWMPKSLLAERFGYDVEKINSDPNIRGIYKCGFYYNGMIVPIFGYRAKGFLWYQGESNRKNADKYHLLMQAMVEDWRSNWGDTKNEMPFIYVQIAHYAYDNAPDGLAAPKVFEAQQKALNLIPNSAMVVTSDVGEKNCIHPSRKDIIGQRAAIEALRLGYGMRIPDTGGVRLQIESVAGNKIILSYKNAEYGLLPSEGKVLGFEIAGEERIFYIAEANILGAKSKIIVSSPEVSKPIAIRYAFRNYIECNLQNTLGYPAFPYRSDDWEL